MMMTMFAVLCLRAPARHAPVMLQATPGECVGIDLGTTSSAIAVVLGDQPEIVPDVESGRGTIPSRVTFMPDGSARVGRGATLTDDSLVSTKRIIGRSLDDARSEPAARALFADSLTPLPDGRAGLKANGVLAAPEDVAAEILSALLQQAEDTCGARASRGVVCVPAHFTEAQRDATRSAAERAGLVKVRLLEEPVAAALAYGVGRGGDDELVMVFDLGGGTLDVSVLRVGGGTAEVLSSAGEPYLGGDDLDMAIADFLGSGPDGATLEDGEPADRHSPSLRRAARRLKEKLTVSKVAEVDWSSLGGGPSSLSLTRVSMEACCADLLSRMREPVIRACAQAQVALPGAVAGGAARASSSGSGGTGSAARALGRPASVKGQRLDCVLRVGAASRTPAVGKMLEALTGIKCPIETVKPEHAVALGAAVQAGILDGSIEQFDVFNPLEAALIRGVSQGSGRRSQRERTGEPSGSRRKKKRRSS